MSQELFEHEANRGAEKLCARARGEAAQVATYRADAARAERAESVCLGRLEQLANHPKISDSWKPPLWLVIPLRVVAVGATSAAAYSLARGLPPEVSVGLAVGGLGAMGFDVVLTLIR